MGSSQSDPSICGKRPPIRSTARFRLGHYSGFIPFDGADVGQSEEWESVEKDFG